MPPGKNTIQEYVHSFQRGQEEGFTFFFEAFYPALLYYAFRLTNNKPAAREIVEEAFTTIWEQHTLFSHQKLIKSWLYTFVRNSSMVWQQNREDLRLPGEKTRSTVNGNAALSAMHELIRTEVAREMHTAINDLPPRCQQVFKLLYIQGKTLKQAAQEMELSIHTIKNQKARGQMLLKKRVPDLFVLFLPFVMW